jgi:hypothetical protein
MFCETESEFQIAVRTRGVGGVAFRRAPQPRPHISLICHPSHAQRLAASYGSFVTNASRILIVTPRLGFPSNATKQTLPAISNRYKPSLLQLGVACTSRFASGPSSLQALLPSPQNLIANLELEFRVNSIRINELKFSNRKFLAVLSFLSDATNRELQTAEFLIENA